MHEITEERAAQDHDDPITVKRGSFSGSGDVVERFYSVLESAPDRFEAVTHRQPHLLQPKCANVFKIFRVVSIDVVALHRFALCRVLFFTSSISSKALQ